ncbi:MAG TPA: hypothetical protein VK961_26065, partial [Chthoniobacter sp.]|nr:hypothetical protein [Chthoniobacter sp.]
MKTSRRLGLLLCSLWAVLAVHASAADWNLVRFDSREYVTLDDIAAFYGLPKPPPVDLTGHFASTTAALMGAFPPTTAPAAAVAPETAPS